MFVRNRGGRNLDAKVADAKRERLALIELQFFEKRICERHFGAARINEGERTVEGAIVADEMQLGVDAIAVKDERGCARSWRGLSACKVRG